MDPKYQLSAGSYVQVEKKTILYGQDDEGGVGVVQEVPGEGSQKFKVKYVLDNKSVSVRYKKNDG